MENLHKEYIYLDGMWLKEEQLLKMASNAGSWNVAEHYLCAYLTNALINGNTEAIKRVNEIRDLYQLDAIPFTNEIEGKLTGTSADYSYSATSTAPADGAFYTASSIKGSLDKANTAVQSISISRVSGTGTPTLPRTWCGNQQRHRTSEAYLS